MERFRVLKRLQKDLLLLFIASEQPPKRSISCRFRGGLDGGMPQPGRGTRKHDDHELHGDLCGGA